jgi:hypothetical protein
VIGALVTGVAGVDVGCTAGAAGATVGAAETGVPCNCTGDVGAAGVAICGAAKGTGV